MIEPELLKKSLKKRRIYVGSEVKIIAGSYKGFKTKVAKIDLKKNRLYLDLKKFTLKHLEVNISTDVSNVERV